MAELGLTLDQVCYIGDDLPDLPVVQAAGLGVAVADGAEELSRAETLSLVRSMNEARLALGARAGAFDMGPRWADHIGSDQRLAVVAWLGSLQMELLRVVPPAR